MKYPVALVGRSAGCDLHLREKSISYRHAYLQVIAGALFCADLDSRSGVCWKTGRQRSGWLTPSRPARIGSYVILPSGDAVSGVPVSPAALSSFNPLDVYQGQFGALPQVELEFLKQGIRTSVLPVRRVLTFVGRSPRCKIQLEDKRVSRFHCSLFLCPDGLYVIDLLGQGGTYVDGAPVGCSRLDDGCVLKVGPYRMRVNYVQRAASSAAPAGDEAHQPTDADIPALDVIPYPATDAEVDLTCNALSESDTSSFSPDDTHNRRSSQACDEVEETVLDPNQDDELPAEDASDVRQRLDDVARRQKLLELERSVQEENARQLQSKRQQLQADRLALEAEKSALDQTQQDLSKAVSRLQQELTELRHERERLATMRQQYAASQAELMLEAEKLRIDVVPSSTVSHCTARSGPSPSAFQFDTQCEYEFGRLSRN